MNIKRVFFGSLLFNFLILFFIFTIILKNLPLLFVNTYGFLIVGTVSFLVAHFYYFKQTGISSLREIMLGALIWSVLSFLMDSIVIIYGLRTGIDTFAKDWTLTRALLYVFYGVGFVMAAFVKRITARTSNPHFK